MRRLQVLGASCGAGAAWFAATRSVFTPATADCDAPVPPKKTVPLHPPTATAVSLAEMRRWLERRGCDLSGIDIRKLNSAAGGDTAPASFGVVATEAARRRTTRGTLGTLASWARLGGRGDVALATVPIASTLTSDSVVRAPGHGPLLAELLDAGVVDARTAVVLHLVVERAQLAKSPLRPWLAMMPDAIPTPLFWSEEDLQWLRGTTLEVATRRVCKRDAREPRGTLTK